MHPPPATDPLTSLRAAGEVPLSELGFRKAAPPASAAAANGGRANITYLHIHEDEELSLGIFCLPAGSVIPLHNHPGMTVLSRVLYGRMHVTSYDWEDPAAEGQPCPRAAAPVLDRVCGPGDAPVVLYPSSGGNIHRFAAETDCAVLDLLSPPYSPDDGRDCTYYREADDNPARAPGQPVMLAQYEPPASFVIRKPDPHLMHICGRTFGAAAVAARDAACRKS
jgi:cysteamine dioxygenase